MVAGGDTFLWLETVTPAVVAGGRAGLLLGQQVKERTSAVPGQWTLTILASLYTSLLPSLCPNIFPSLFPTFSVCWTIADCGLAVLVHLDISVMLLMSTRSVMSVLSTRSLMSVLSTRSVMLLMSTRSVMSMIQVISVIPLMLLM